LTIEQILRIGCLKSKYFWPTYLRMAVKIGGW